jgi:hypothetical protein
MALNASRKIVHGVIDHIPFGAFNVFSSFFLGVFGGLKPCARLYSGSLSLEPRIAAVIGLIIP